MRRLYVGIGCRRGVSSDDIERAVEKAFHEAGVSWDEPISFASVDLKSDEAGLLDFVAKKGCEITFFAKSDLETVSVPTPSAKVAEKIGVVSVGEASALLAGGEGACLILTKRKYGNVTVAIAER